jgi:hypoxanthine phosphoribosyltransferase
VNHKLIQVYSAEHIAAVVERLAQEISADYAGRELLVLVVLKGAFIFAADLLRKLSIPAMVEFVEIASYCGTQSTGTATVIRSTSTSVQGSHVLVVEDIIDEGRCLSSLLSDLRAADPASLRVCTLIDNRRRRTIALEPDYAGMRCTCGFLVGYGLDMDQHYRELPALYELVETGA